MGNTILSGNLGTSLLLMICEAPPRVSFKYHQIARREIFFLSSERIIMKSLQSSLFPKMTSRVEKRRLTLFICMIALLKRMGGGVGLVISPKDFLHCSHRRRPQEFLWNAKEVFQQLLLESGSGQGFLPQQQILPRLAEVPDHSSYQELVFLLLEQLMDSSVPGLFSTTSKERLWERTAKSNSLGSQAF